MFGYKEALGYAVGDWSDKDGISAALALLSLASQRPRGRPVFCSTAGTPWKPGTAST